LPLYPYRCKECAHRFEKIQKFGAKPETVCPKCGGVLERTLTAPGLNFKGAGWYVNDYAPKSTSSKSESGGASGSEAGSGSASESAPAEKKSGSETKTETKSETKAASSGESSSTSSAKSAPATASGKAAK
jgi:putative FmdB family regulatory protein